MNSYKSKLVQFIRGSGKSGKWKRVRKISIENEKWYRVICRPVVVFPMKLIWSCGCKVSLRNLEPLKFFATPWEESQEIHSLKGILTF